MENLNDLFKNNSKFTIYVVEQKFVIGLKKIFHVYQI